MSSEVMDLDQVAAYLHRDAREVMKLASRGHLPGQRVGGHWRFHRVEINHWIETQMHAYTEQELTALEAGGRPQEEPELLLTSLLGEACVSVPLPATTKSSVLRELVRVAEQSWQVYDPAAVLEAELGGVSPQAHLGLLGQRDPSHRGWRRLLGRRALVAGVPRARDDPGSEPVADHRLGFDLARQRDDFHHSRALHVEHGTAVPPGSGALLSRRGAGPCCDDSVAPAARRPEQR